jgi:membrane associated rhomboid family serine protease
VPNSPTGSKYGKQPFANFEVMFLPVKPDFRLQRFPWLTALVCLICAVVFSGQLLDRHEYDEAVSDFCDMDRSRLKEMVFARIEANHHFEYCDDIAYALHNSTNESETLSKLMSEMVPPDPDDGLAYYSESWNPWTMLTSSFAHGGWAHIAFNLVFFIAFGTLVEMLIGGFAYAGLIIIVSWICGVFTSVSAMANGEAVASLGLSGVVMGMIGLSAFLLPRAKIRCYYWFIILFGSVALPVWALAIWYIGSDIYVLFAYDDHGFINVMAHVTGGIGGYLFGVLFLRKARIEAQGVQMTLDRSELRPKFF